MYNGAKAAQCFYAFRRQVSVQVQQNQNLNQQSSSISGQSGQSGGGLTRSDSFKGGSHSDSCAGGEKAIDLPDMSDIFQDIVTIPEWYSLSSTEPEPESTVVIYFRQSGDQAIQNHMFYQVLKVSDFTENGFFENDEPGWK
nr:hypothetical protein [Tanacetum cinerariifolium]